MIPLGAGIAMMDRLRRGHVHRDLLHGIIAFGGGALFAAVALVLVPEGLARLGTIAMAAAFLGGALTFLVLDRALERRGGRVAQFMAMLLDFVPESIALGAIFSAGGATGPLLAILIGLQNLPEGFNSLGELVKGHFTRRHAFAVLAPMALLGPLAGILGYYLLGDQSALLGGVMIFAAGGILYLLFHDVVPLAHQRGHWVPALGAVAGFLLGMVGEHLVG